MWIVYIIISLFFISSLYCEDVINKIGEGNMENKKLISEGNLNKDEEQTLLKLSRDTLTMYIKDHKTPDVANYKLTDNLKNKYGVFVTLKEKGELRGCIGYIERIMELYKGVIDNTINASTRDPRFAPVSAKELDDIDIEISVMTPLKKIENVDEIVVGKHGLVIKKNGRSGLLLPQVPIEWDWDKDEYLMHICLKAGLPTDAWKTGADIYIFSAQVFGEKE